jgi:hypothetical protein
LVNIYKSDPELAAHFNDHMTSRDGINNDQWIRRDPKGSDRGVISGVVPALNWKA